MPGVAAEIWTNILRICVGPFRNTKSKVVLVKEGGEAGTYIAHREHENCLQSVPENV